VIHFTSPVGWLPVHRDQLRAQRSVTSMGKLYLFLGASNNDPAQGLHTLKSGSVYVHTLENTGADGNVSIARNRAGICLRNSCSA